MIKNVSKDDPCIYKAATSKEYVLRIESFLKAVISTVLYIK